MEILRGGIEEVDSEAFAGRLKTVLVQNESDRALLISGDSDLEAGLAEFLEEELRQRR